MFLLASDKSARVVATPNRLMLFVAGCGGLYIKLSPMENCDFQYINGLKKYFKIIDIASCSQDFRFVGTMTLKNTLMAGKMQ